jgi:hypothetical protein
MIHTPDMACFSCRPATEAYTSGHAFLPYLNFLQAVPQLRWLVTSFSLLRSELIAGQAMGIVMDKKVLGLVSSDYSHFL